MNESTATHEKHLNKIREAYNVSLKMVVTGLLQPSLYLCDLRLSSKTHLLPAFAVILGILLNFQVFTGGAYLRGPSKKRFFPLDYRYPFAKYERTVFISFRKS